MSRFDRDINSILSGSGSLYSARSIAVGLSFFLAACSSPGVKVAAPDALGSSKSSHILEPQSPLSVASIGDITLNGDYPDDKLAPEVMAPFGVFSPTLHQVDLAYCHFEEGIRARYVPLRQGDHDADYYLFQTSADPVTQLQQVGFEPVKLVSHDASDIWEDGYSNTLAVTYTRSIPHADQERDASHRPVSGKGIFVVTLHGRIREEIGNSVLSRYGYSPLEGQRNTVSVTRLVFDVKARLQISQNVGLSQALEVSNQRHVLGTHGVYISKLDDVRNDNESQQPLDANLDTASPSVSGKIYSLRDISSSAPIMGGLFLTTRPGKNLTRTDYPERRLILDERTGISITNPAIFSGAPPGFNA